MAPLMLLEIRLQSSAHHIMPEHVKELLDEGRTLAICDAVVEGLSLISSRDSAANRVS